MSYRNTNTYRKDKQLLKTMFMENQKAIYNRLIKFLKKHYSEDKIIIHEKYLCAIGDIPIALVAHMDTVWEDNIPKFIFFDNEQGVFWGLDGLGADDKAGIFAIMKIVEAGLRPHIIFTTDEEIGGLGAEVLVENGNPFSELKFLIELDRRGSQDCVFYDCETKDFMKYIETFGFKTAHGSFSDISILCGAWQICGVNLSVGYLNEHTHKEILVMPCLYETINKVKQILSQEFYPTFKWEGATYLTQTEYYKMYGSSFETGPLVTCQKCFYPVPINEALRVKSKRFSNGHCYYCYACLADAEINFCKYCNEPFEEQGGTLIGSVCPECQIKEGKIDYNAIRANN